MKKSLRGFLLSGKPLVAALSLAMLTRFACLPARHAGGDNPLHPWVRSLSRPSTPGLGCGAAPPSDNST